jgi:hypothetical protein
MFSTLSPCLVCGSFQGLKPDSTPFKVIYARQFMELFFTGGVATVGGANRIPGAFNQG